eukprot:scaffold102952_cov63-Phaeocystis_antarctica.AAC.3
MLRPVHLRAVGPVVACARDVREDLLPVEEVAQRTAQDLTNHALLRVHEHRARAQRGDRVLPSGDRDLERVGVPCVHVPEERGHGVVEEAQPVVLYMLAQHQVPEPPADLVAALAHLDGHDFAHFVSRALAGRKFRVQARTLPEATRKGHRDARDGRTA